MNRILSVCFLVVGLVAGVGIFVARQVAVSAAGQADRPLQRGVSVHMATSSNAAPMPEADNESAWIVTVTADAQIYFGTNQVTADGLTEQMKTRPRNRTAKLYIKGDARAPFSSVQQVLYIARVCLFDEVILLTSQPEPAQLGTIVPPKGLDVWIDNEAAENVVTVQVGSRDGSPTVRIDNEDVAPSALQGRLAQIFDTHAGRVVLLKASGTASYAQVVHAIDACRGAGASRVALSRPEL